MGIMSLAELTIHKRMTKAFIEANYIELALIPRERLNSGSGSRLVDGTQRPVQRLRLIDQTRTFGPEPGTVLAADGKQRKAEFQLLGEHDATIGLYDYWIQDGIKYEVANVAPFNGYERRAQVVRYGEG